ncbi:MAG: hypothetical protein AAF387_13425 [Pseudomonadota bacterium]
MFRSQQLVKPKKQSILLTITVVVIAFLGSQTSAVLGYLLGLMGLLAIIFASLMDSFWPTRSKPENSVAFALFWGMMIGAVLPFMLNIFLEGGFKAVYEMLPS